jgi:hypothetical protein
MTFVKTSIVQAKGYILDLGVGRVDIENAPTIVNPSILFRYESNFPAGDLVFNVPNSTTFVCRGVMITVDPACTTTKTLKGAAGDTGIKIATAGLGGTSYILLDSVSTFIINNSGADTIPTILQYF